MKHFVGVVVLVALAILVRFVVSQRFGVDIYIRNTYWVPFNSAAILRSRYWLLSTARRASPPEMSNAELRIKSR